MSAELSHVSPVSITSLGQTPEEGTVPLIVIMTYSQYVDESVAKYNEEKL